MSTSHHTDPVTMSTSHHTHRPSHSIYQSPHRPNHNVYQSPHRPSHNVYQSPHRPSHNVHQSPHTPSHSHSIYQSAHRPSHSHSTSQHTDPVSILQVSWRSCPQHRCSCWRWCSTAPTHAPPAHRPSRVAAGPPAPGGYQCLLQHRWLLTLNFLCNFSRF